jgi:hypothetical protein
VNAIDELQDLLNAAGVRAYWAPLPVCLARKRAHLLGVFGARAGQMGDGGRPWREPVVLFEVGPFRPNVPMMRRAARDLGWGQPPPGPSALWAKLEPLGPPGGKG